MELSKNFIVEKANALNEIRKNNMSLQELRFFCIYLSKINARDKSSRVVTFPLEDFQKIMEMTKGKELSKFENNYIRECFKTLLQQIVEIPNSDGTKGFTFVQVFKECKLYQNDFGQWQVEIDAHDKVLPYMFDLKNYVKYNLSNVLGLSSINQLRMYEILKQYENTKEKSRIFSLKDLKLMLGLKETEYSRWSNFKMWVIDSCQQALLERTDICFEYETIKSGRKVTGIKFFIRKNENYIDQLMLDEFIGLQTVADEVDPDKDNSLSLLSEACKNEFDIKELEQIQALLYQLPPDKLPPISGMPAPSVDLQRYHYLMYKYANFCRLSAQHDKVNDPIEKRFGFFIKTIKADLLDS